MQVFRLLYIFTISFCLCNHIIAQNYNYKHFTVEDGLPSSEVYSTFQDSRGYIWFATDAGVSRFNGYEFKNFDVKDGLTDNTVFLIREDSEGRIWFGTFNKKICYFYNDSIYPFEHNDKILKTIDGNAILHSFAIDKDGTVWMGFALYGMLNCTQEGNIKLLSSKKENKFIVYEINGYQVWTFSRNEDVLFDVLDTDVSVLQQVKLEYHEQNKSSNYGVFNITFNSRESEGLYNVAIEKTIENKLLFFEDSLGFLDFKKGQISFKTTSLKNRFHNRILSTNTFDGYLWICVQNEGIYKYKIKNQNLMFEENILVSKLVSRIFKDNEGGYWITTLKEGVYYLKNNNFKSDDIVVSSIDVDTQNKVVYLGLKDKKILKRKINETPLTYTKITESDDIPQNIVFDKSTNSILADGYFETLRKIYSTGLNKKIKVIHPSTKAAIIEGNKIYRVNSNGFSKIVDDVEVYYSLRDGQKKYWCTSLIKENENIWIGTNQGLICFNNVKHLMLEPFKNNDILSTGVTCLEKFNNEIVLIGTKSFGLVLMKNGKIIDIIDEQKGLVGDLVKSVHVDYQDEIWVGTNNGLSRLNYHSSKNYHIQNITTKHGLISNEIAHIKSCDNTIFLVTPKNLIEFDKTKVLINKTRLPIHITGFKVNDKELKFTVDTIIELSYNENRIDINFESLNYKSLGNIEYKYKLSDIDTMWYNTTQNTVNFYGLSSGNYTFEVKAKNEDGFWSHPVKIRFKINPPFWLTWWFISVEILMLLLVIIGVFKFRETQIRIKSKNAQRLAENEKKIIELELKALKSQINPHFIFNTLNSIQHFISSNNFKDSNRYITNFSKLIRMVLNHSDKSYITLRDETEMLNLYLSLEQVRFSEGFDYVLKVNDNIDLDYDKIAPMLLQPFIENAIWHGLMNKKEKGFVEVSFSLDNDFLICTISDNGIGRDAAEKIKSARGIQNKSVGMTITKERLNIINNEVYENMNVEMIDLFDDKKQASGTKVIIKIKLN